MLTDKDHTIAAEQDEANPVQSLDKYSALGSSIVAAA